MAPAKEYFVALVLVAYGPINYQRVPITRACKRTPARVGSWIGWLDSKFTS